jgi:hypothetical protein
MNHSRPRIFVSSTVHDFLDLRSALKWQLEQLGFTVQMSEYADFEKPIEQNSYQACFDAIRACNAFVLLVGSRRGGWYNSDEGITITQQEYRVAYEESKRRDLPIVACIRRTVWDQYSYAKELAKGTTSIEPSPTKFIDDPEHLGRFLDEIRRLEEMKAASALGQALPRGNWIHQFAGFEELLDVVKIALRVNREVAGQLLLRQVCDELSSYCAGFLSKSKTGVISSPFDALPDLMRSLQITTRRYIQDPSPHVRVSQKHVAHLAAMSLHAAIQTNMPLRALEELTVSPIFAMYDSQSGGVLESPIQRACRRTLAAIRRAEQYEPKARDSRGEFLREGAGSGSAPEWDLTPMAILGVVANALDVARVLAEAENVIQHILYQAPLVENPAAHVPRTPFSDQAASLAAQTADGRDFNQWTRGRTRS